MRPTLRALAVLVFFGVCLYALTAKMLVQPETWFSLPKEYLQLNNVLKEMQWESGYQFLDNCEMRANRSNPRFHPALFPCPVKHEWGTDLNLRSGSYRYSSKNCSNGHCSYQNVCLDPPTKTFHFYEQIKGTYGVNDFGWHVYRDTGGKVSFSWHFRTKVVSELPKNTTLWANGTSIWFDQSYANFCHVGHSSEVYTKLVELRKLFPGPIERIMYTTNAEFKGRPDAYQFCYIPCNEMRVAFEEENWQFPTVYWLLLQKEYIANKTICFENVLVPASTHQHFTSREAAAMHRSSALRMCNIPERPTPKVPRTVFFYQRGHERQMYNVEELCSYSKQLGYSSYIETDDHPDYCQQIASMYSADIIVSVDGSHNHLLSYARPGSVLILVIPFNFRVPDWKLLGHIVGLRVLELMTLNASYSIPHPGQSIPQRTRSLEKKLLDCYTYECRVNLRHDDTYVPVENFDKFLKWAVQIWNNATAEPCELPLPWPVPVKKGAKYLRFWQQYGYACNYQVCEPPAPDCLCCQDKDCMEAAMIDRGF
jgi:hypothetical protein